MYFMIYLMDITRRYRTRYEIQHRRGTAHKNIFTELTTKRKLEDDFDLEEAMGYDVQKRKYLIQDVTGTLSDNGLKKDDDN